MARPVRRRFSWGALLRWMRPPRRAVPTRAGWFVLASPIPLGLAAVTAGNNLLFMLLAAALGSVVISGILSERNLRGVRVRLGAVGVAWAGESTSVRVLFERPPSESDRGAPRYALRIRERRGRWSPWRPRRERGDRLDGVLAVLDDARQDLIVERCFAVRGRARVGHLEISTRYPFGLLEKSRDVDGEIEVCVRPHRVPLPDILRRPRAKEGTGDRAERKGVGTELYGVRERNEWDDALRVHALRSLALRREVVLETAGVERPAAWLAVAGGRGTEPEAFERALEIAAAALMAWDQAGWEVGLSLPGRALPPGRASREAMLDALAAHEERTVPTIARGAVWLVPAGARPPDGERAFSISGLGAVAERST